MVQEPIMVPDLPSTCVDGLSGEESTLAQNALPFFRSTIPFRKVPLEPRYFESLPVQRGSLAR